MRELLFSQEHHIREKGQASVFLPTDGQKNGSLLSVGNVLPTFSAKETRNQKNFPPALHRLPGGQKKPESRINSAFFLKRKFCKFGKFPCYFPEDVI